MKSQPKFLSLQVLRIVACSLVLLFHTTLTIATNDHGSMAVWKGGVVGVDIFFALSGFVMLYSAEKLHRASAGWRTFAVHRLLRVVPLYWICTLIYLAGGIASSTRVLHRAYFLGWVLGSFFFLPFAGPGGQFYPVCPVGWTLVFEMLFYFLVGCVLLLGLRVFPWVSLALVLLTIGSLFRKPGWPGIGYYLDPLVLEFCFGMIVYRLRSAGRTLPTGLAVGVSGALVPYVLWYPFQSASWRVLALGVPAALLVYAFVSMEHYFVRLPDWLLFLADTTYVLYLLHEGIIEVITRRMSHYPNRYSWLTFLLCIGLSWTVACVLRIYLEVPLQRALRERISPSVVRGSSAIGVHGVIAGGE